MIYNEHEMTYITPAELAEDAQKLLFEKISGVISQFEGDIFIHDAWGRRKLAYPIKRNSYGHYVYLNFVGPADLPLELERIIRLDDKILRFLTVKLGYNVEIEEARVVAAARHQKWIDSRSVQNERDGRDDGPRR